MLLVKTIIALVAGYTVFLIIRTGLHHRIFLALGPISIERIPDRAARKYGEKILFTSDVPCKWEVPALRDKYKDLNAWSAMRIKLTAGYVAKILQSKFGIHYGVRVAIFKKNHFDYHIFHTSVVRAGGIACPINDKFKSDKIDTYLVHLKAQLLISDLETVIRVLQEGGSFGDVKKIILAESEKNVKPADKEKLNALLASHHPELEIFWLEETLENIREEITPVKRTKDDPFYLVHSSGTTGFPKAVILKNGPQSHAIRGWLCYVHLSRNRNKAYLAVPNNHQAVMLTFNSVLLWGFPVHWVGPYSRDGFNAEKVIRELSEGAYSGYFGFPITYTQLKEIPLENYNLDKMAFWASTADASHEVIIRPFVKTGSAFKSLGLPIKGSVFLDAQGSSEVGTPSVIRYITSFTRKFDRRIGRPGSTPFGPRIRVVTPDGIKVKRNEVGRLEVKGKTLFAGYWNYHDLTFMVKRDGWFFTGDVVRRGRDRHLIQLDREVDVIKTKYGDVYSLPIEEKLHKHPAVFDLCVYGEIQPDGWQLPAVAVSLRSAFQMSETQLKEEFNALLEEREQLNSVQITDWKNFPIGVTGKTLKRVFRDRSRAVSA